MDSPSSSANRVLEQFLPRFNQRFGVPPQYPEPAFRPLDPELRLEPILCFKHKRRVARDNTVRFRLPTLQLLPGRERHSYAGAAVEVLEGLDGRLSVRPEGRIVPAHEAPPSPVFLRNGHGRSTPVPHPFLSHLPAPTAGANAGPRLSNHWTQGQRKKRFKGPSPTALTPPASLKLPLRASRRSFRKSDGRRFRKPGARAGRCGQSSGTWELTGPP